MRRLWRLLVGLFAVTGFLVVLLAVAGAGLAWWVELRRGADLPGSMVLSVDLRGSLPEVPAADLLSLLDEAPQLTLAQTVLAIDRAAQDPRVDGLVARLDGGGGWAQAEELRNAVQRLRQAGKKAWAFSDGFGELSPGNEGYLLATGFERIVLQPSGTVGLTGVAIEVPYAKALLDRLGVNLQVVRRAEYKSAFDALTRTEMSAAEREMLGAVAQTMHSRLVQSVVQGRERSAQEAEGLIAGGPYAAQEALDLGLIDAIDWYDSLEAEIVRTPDGAETRLVALERYAMSLSAPDGAAATVAVLQADGPIVRGEGGEFEQALIGADALAEMIDSTAADDDVQAIVLRLNSPGGSPAASETIARALRNAIEGGKPVVVSMGDVAASGGYWIAKDASAILASPSTLTGSIGVVSLKPDLSAASAELGIAWTELSTAPHAGMWSLGRPYSNAEAARTDELVGALYADFTNGVALARGLSPQRVEEIARGRVWSGEAARDLDLVDGTGGLLQAIEEAKRLKGLSPDASVAIVFAPAGDTLGRILRRAVGLEARIGAALGQFARVGAVLQPGLRAVTLEPTIR